ncbi:hypothetical protein [Sporosarcina psychrophila]|uniref:hypothetical protein n=1 Tax=Sporosarcina psychrophila TaxID=1476 RepID=UPI00078D945B|nr:hypothetical protein [Sporosarcina psychrophila]AMQ06224.1 hypothetical protein AZE41_09960 [Sporosarcina psychrophila]
MESPTGIEKGTSTGANFSGRRNLTNERLDNVLLVAGILRKVAEVIFMNGVGGSYLGVKAIQDVHSSYCEKIKIS